MGLRIATNVPSLTAQRNLQESSSQQNRSLARLSSGQRIVNAGDDAAGMAIGQNLLAETRGLKQAQRNANDGISFVQTAEGSLNEVSNILIRLRELGVQAASDTLGDEERGYLNKEFSTLKSEVDRIANVSNFNGRKLLDGSGGSLSFQVGSKSGENNRIDFHSNEADARASSLGISGAGVASKGDALDSLESVDSAINKINSYRSSMGALQNRLHSASNNLGSQVENLSEARSRITDTDIAEEASTLAKNNILQAAGVAVLAQANSNTSNALKLL
ncbi:MAG: flagellin N-terminal helical domain-containing protein [Bdellovibrionota bacterium]